MRQGPQRVRHGLTAASGFDRNQTLRHRKAHGLNERAGRGSRSGGARLYYFQESTRATMQTPLQITFRNFPRSDAVEARIRDNAAKLEEFHPRIMSCHVVVEERDRHHHQGKQFTVRLDIRVPGHEVVVDRDHHEDIYVALRDAFNAAGRKLEEVVRTGRGDVKVHEVPQHGKVARLFPDEGYGFIETADGREFYFSSDNVVEPSFDRLETGAEVQFVEDVAGDGRQHATRVSAGKHRPLAG